MCDDGGGGHRLSEKKGMGNCLVSNGPYVSYHTLWQENRVKMEGSGWKATKDETGSRKQNKQKLRSILVQGQQKSKCPMK